MLRMHHTQTHQKVRHYTAFGRIFARVRTSMGPIPYQSNAQETGLGDEFARVESLALLQTFRMAHTHSSNQHRLHKHPRYLTVTQHKIGLSNMSILTLTSAQRSALRARAHELSPVVMIGDAGLSEAIIKETENSLVVHELIKVRVFSDDKQERTLFAEQLCLRLGAVLVQHIGKLLVLYRPASHAPKKQTFAQSLMPDVEGTKTKGAGLRRVTIVKQASPNERPRAKNVLVKGNERVTQGGTVKRAKKKTVSAKKSMG
jgi:RNA-binding protein